MRMAINYGCMCMAMVVWLWMYGYAYGCMGMGMDKGVKVYENKASRIGIPERASQKSQGTRE